MIRFPLDRRTLSEEDHLIIKVLRLYYERHLTQNEVARRMGFSRPKVSKLISEGRARGLVKIEIATPGEDFAALEISVEDRHGLPEAVVASSEESREATELSVGAAAAAVLARMCTRSTVLGVSWGRSSRALADAVGPQAFAAGKVVPLVGGMGRAESALHSNQIAAAIAERLFVESLYLSAPAIAPSAQSREELMRMPGIEEVLAEGAACDVAVVGIGGILPSSTLVGAGYFSKEEFIGLKDRGVVGDVCFHFLDAGGRPCLPEFSRRVIGLTLDRLREVPKVVGLATGAEKAEAVAAAIRGGYVSTLVCDRELAEALLEIG